MTLEDVLAIAQQMVKVALLVSAPLLGISLVAGLTVSIFQALTQINEMGLVFIFKIVAVALVFILFLPWLLSHMSEYTTSIFTEIPRLGR